MGIDIAFVSLGCDKNLVDSEVMLGLLQEAGFRIVAEEAIAEVLVVNTCCFIQDAKEESIENILEMAQYKTTGRCKALIVTGCMAERYKEEILTEMPEVDAVVGTTSYEKIVEVIQEVLKGKKIQQFSDINYTVPENPTRLLSTPGYYGYLKIAEGCDNCCTYCIIPKLRGQYRSRTMENIVEEAKRLAGQGVRELILVAQDTTSYGMDVYGDKKLPELLSRLNDIEELHWIRILYCYPEQITDALIAAIAELPKVCKYLDMPIQHANNAVLKRMARRSSQEKLREVIQKLRERVPHIALRTTLIVGFPGETEEQFQDLFQFVKEVEFDRLGVFTYSAEEDTPAFDFENPVPQEVMEQRKTDILEVQKYISARKCEAAVGKIVEVLIEGKLPEENVYCGRTYKDAPEIDGMVFVKSEEEILSGEFVAVRITGAYDYDWVGEIVDEPCQ